MLDIQGVSTKGSHPLSFKKMSYRNKLLPRPFIHVHPAGSVLDAYGFIDWPMLRSTLGRLQVTLENILPSVQQPDIANGCHTTVGVVGKRMTIGRILVGGIGNTRRSDNL